MQNTKYISTKELTLILIFSFLAFAFFAAAIGADVVASHESAAEKAVREFSSISVGCRLCDRDFVAGFNLITFFIFLALIRPKRFIVSTALTFIYGALLVVSIYLRLDGTGALGGVDFYTDPWVEFINKTDVYDYVASFVIVVLLGWQSSIVWRIYRSKGNGQMP